MKTKNRLVLFCALALVLTLAVGATLAYFYGESTVENKFTTAGDGDGPSPTITEPNWSEKPTDEPDFPGDVRPKDPTLVNKGGDGYGRIMIELKDKSGALITDSARAQLIMDMIVYSTTPITTPQSKAQIDAMDDFNKALFEYDTARSTTGRYFYNLKDILKGSDRATLFTYVCYPTDFGQAEMDLAGDFSIVVTGQMIQAQNLTKDTAMDALQKEYEGKGTATPAPTATPTTTP